MNQQKTDFRITVLNVTLDDLEPFFPHIKSMIERFERTYAHLKLDFSWFFQDYQDDFVGPDSLGI